MEKSFNDLLLAFTNGIASFSDRLSYVEGLVYCSLVLDVVILIVLLFNRNKNM